MRISQILQRSTQLYPHKPFLVTYNDDETSMSGKSLYTNTYTYRDSSRIAASYERWIRNQIMAQMKMQIPRQSQIQSLSRKDKVSHVDVVVAFLSHNSPDLLLAIMGGMNVHASIIMMGTNMNIDSDSDSNTNTVSVSVSSAMLNVRWSANEIAKALAVPNDETRMYSGANAGADAYAGAGVRHMTLIIYGREMEDVAKEACGILNSTCTGVLDQNQGLDSSMHTGSHHSSSCVLPAIADIQQKMERNVMRNNKKQEDRLRGNYMEKSDGAADADADAGGSGDHINDDALLLFTSGTTSGKPKGVRLSHMALLIQAMAKITSPCSYDSSTRMLATSVPFFHVGGISSALAIILCGGMLVFPPTSKSKSVQGFNPTLVMKCLHRQNETNIKAQIKLDINTLVVVPAMLHAIFREIETMDHIHIPVIYADVRLVLVGGQSITTPQLEKSKLYFPNARIVQTYACTEAGSSITFATMFDPNDHDHYPEGQRKEDQSNYIPNNGLRAGFPPHHVDLKIFKIDSNDKPLKQFAATGEIGAIGTRGPHVMNGYWKRGRDQISRTESMSRNNENNEWLVMNDLGYMDESGQLYFCGRSNDVIRSGGESVFAPEVERAILQNSQVDICSVFALPDEKFGECVCAAIVLKGSEENIHALSPIIESKEWMVQIRSFCADHHLTSYKRPRSVFLCSELPRNSSGKVLKHVLSSQCAQAREKQVLSKL